MKKIILIILVLLINFLAKAQVKGVIIDSAGKSVDKAVVGLVVKSNPSDTNYIFTNEKGEFQYEKVPDTSFTLIVNNIGYTPVAKFINITQPEKTINIGNITLIPQAKLLQEVIVQAAPITIKEDTIEYRADAFKVKENAVVEDLLKKLPGVEVDKDGNLKAQGKSVTKVKVNGKDFFGGDPKTATKELPANLVDKIQVIDDYGDQATVSGIKDGDPEKILNIQLKKDKNKGFFGRATAGIGTEERYQASLNGNYFNNNTQISLFSNSNNTNQSLFNFGSFDGNRGMGNMMRMGMNMMNDMGGMSAMQNAFQNGDGGFFSSGQNNNNGITTNNSIGLNYRDQWGKRINVYGSYSYSHRNNNILQLTSQQNFYQNSSFINNQNNNITNIGDNHRFYFNLEYQIDSFNYLKINPSISYAETNSNNNTLFDYAQAKGQITSDGKNNNQRSTLSPAFNGSILYNHKFRKRGRNFSVNLTLGGSGSNSDQDAQNITNSYIAPVGTFIQNQFIQQDNDNHNYGVRVTYSEPLSKTRNLDITYSHNNNYARNDKKTFNIVPNTNDQTFVPFLSNDFENNFYNNRIGISVRTTTKKYNYTLGVSAQPVNLQGKSITKDSAYQPIKRMNVFPIARFTYNFSKSKTLNINYSGNATQPTFTQLQDVLDISNQQYATRGNPNLKPSINHNINLSYNNFNMITGRVIFTNVTFSTIQNQIVNNNIRNGNNGAQLSIPENVNGYYNVAGFYTYSRPFQNRRYVVSVNGRANYNNNINLVDSIRTIGQNWIISQGLNVEYNLKDWLMLGTGVNYSLNDVKYKNTTANIFNNLQNTSSNAWNISSNISIDFLKSWVFRYDFDYTINNGLANNVNGNLAIMNASIEKQFFARKNGIVKLSAYDLFNQNTNINRNVTANSIVDTRTNRLNRYFMLSFTYRLQKFQGKRPQGNGMRGRMLMDN